MTADHDGPIRLPVPPPLTPAPRPIDVIVSPALESVVQRACDAMAGFKTEAEITAALAAAFPLPDDIVWTRAPFPASLQNETDANGSEPAP